RSQIKNEKPICPSYYRNSRKRNDKAKVSEESVIIRSYVPNDRNYILSTWLSGLRYGSDYYLSIDKESYFSVYHDLIESIIDDKATAVRVSALKSDPDTILGYSVVTSKDTVLE